MKKILVTWAWWSASHNVIMSLKNNPKNEEFYIVWADAHDKYIELSCADKKYIVPKCSEPWYLESINKIIEIEWIDFIHAQPDPEVNFLSANRDKILCKSLFPSNFALELCWNKMAFNNFLTNQWLAVPEAYMINNEHDLEISLKKILQKHPKAWLRAIRWAWSKWALPVSELSHAISRIDYRNKNKWIWYGNFMLSEFLPWNEYAFQSIRNNWELIMSQARQRVEYLYWFLSPSGQSSTPAIAKTIHNEEINQLVYKTVKAIDPHATWIFCADLKTNIDWKIMLMEINCWRFFTTSYFFSAAWCNMPYHHIKLWLWDTIEYTWPKFNCIPADRYWIRMVDMGYKLIKNNEWTALRNY